MGPNLTDVLKRKENLERDNTHTEMMMQRHRGKRQPTMREAETGSIYKPRNMRTAEKCHKWQGRVVSWIFQREHDPADPLI